MAGSLKKKSVHIPYSEIAQEKAVKAVEVIGLRFTYLDAKACDLTEFAEFDPLISQLCWGMYDRITTNGLTKWSFELDHSALRKFCNYLKYRKAQGLWIPTCVLDLTGAFMEEYTTWLITKASGGYADNGKKFRALREVLKHYYRERPEQKNPDIYWVKNPFPNASSTTSTYKALTKGQMTELARALTKDLANLAKQYESVYMPQTIGQMEPLKFADEAKEVYTPEYCQWYFDNVLAGTAYYPRYVLTHHWAFYKSVAIHWGDSKTKGKAEAWVGPSALATRAIYSKGLLRFYKHNNVYYRVQTPQLLPYLLLFATRTGINAYSLLNITVDCIKPHPSDPTIAIITWWKGRAQRDIEQPHRTPTKAVKKGKQQHDVAAESADAGEPEELIVEYARTDYPVPLIERLIEITAPLRRFASDADRNHLLLIGTCQPGGVSRVSEMAYSKAVEDFKNRHALEFSPSLSAIRPAAGTSVFMATKGDIAKVTTFLGKKHINDAARYVRDYFAPVFHKEWQHAGVKLQEFLLEGDPDMQVLADSLGVPSEQASRIYNGEMDTLMGRCKDVFNSPQPGQTKGEACTAAWKCLVCRSHVLFPEDLWKIYSFYNYLELKRLTTGVEEFNAKYAPFMRIVDEDITPSFKPETVAEQKQRAKDDPFPAWDPVLVAALDSMNSFA